MKQYECSNIPQVAHKVAELTNTAVDRDTWRYYCHELKKSGNASDTVDYIDGLGNDITVFFGYDGTRWLVGIE